MIAALFVATNGIYFGLDNVDPWDEYRDATKYNGPYPVVAHPPCQRWSMLSASVEAKYGYWFARGNDGGTFESALESVEKYGGILEHPAYSAAWQTFNLEIPHPNRWEFNGDEYSRWIRARCGWTCQVNQSNYGHDARKRTWLYFVGNSWPPELDWFDMPGTHTISCDKNAKRKRLSNGTLKPFLSHKQALATPIAFRDLLISLAVNSK